MKTLIGSSNNKWMTLFATSLGTLILNVDLFIVNVALPSMSNDFRAPLSTLTWTISVYALMIGIFPAGMGRLADIWGQKRLYISGLSLFTFSSFACGLSHSVVLLILFRTMQGVGAAAMTPGTLSLLVRAFPQNQRGLAIGINNGIGSLGLIAGPVLGGLLVHGDNWRWVFWVNVPLGIIAILLTVLFINDSETGLNEKVDWLGLIALSFGLFLILFSITEIKEQSHGWVLICFLAGVIALLLFVWHERRSREPLIDLSLFRNTAFLVPCLCLLLFSISLFGSQSYWSMFMQNFWGFSPLLGGLAFLPATVAIAALTPISGIISQRSGTKLRFIIISSAGLVGVGFFIGSTINQQSTYFNTLFPALFVRGIGIPFLMSSTALMIMNAVPKEKMGLASGMLNMSRNFGTALGVSILGQIYSYDTSVNVLALGKGLSNDLIEKAQVMTAQFETFQDKVMEPISNKVILAGFGHLGTICAVAMIPVILCAAFIKPKSNGR
jgi:EmrB/QacA subfamily drug resistance transporter